MVRICAEEGFHKKQGQEMIIRYAQGTPTQRALAQEAIDRWWWPALMMFGPHDSESSNTPQLVRWGIKTKTNDELRQEFIDEMVPALAALGLSVPDAVMHYDEATGHWAGSEIDWEEFWRVIKGDGPMNAARLSARRQAHEDGRWVREAAAAYATKLTADGRPQTTD
jgi:ring-1,2-phenylacetyl-CoA epoxidase subunit PaaA